MKTVAPIIAVMLGIQTDVFALSDETKKFASAAERHGVMTNPAEIVDFPFSSAKKYNYLGLLVQVHKIGNVVAVIDIEIPNNDKKNIIEKNAINNLLAVFKIELPKENGSHKSSNSKLNYQTKISELGVAFDTKGNATNIVSWNKSYFDDFDKANSLIVNEAGFSWAISSIQEQTSSAVSDPYSDRGQ
jgi:hypothetical protein